MIGPPPPHLRASRRNAAEWKRGCAHSHAAPAMRSRRSRMLHWRAFTRRTSLCEHPGGIPIPRSRDAYAIRRVIVRVLAGAGDRDDAAPGADHCQRGPRALGVIERGEVCASGEVRAHFELSLVCVWSGAPVCSSCPHHSAVLFRSCRHCADGERRKFVS